MVRMKKGFLPKVFLIGLGLLLVTYYYGMKTGRISRPSPLKTLIPIAADRIDATVLQTSDVKVLPLPSNTPVSSSGPMHRIETWAWNANMAAFLANGGVRTTKGSLIAGYNLNVAFQRQDDNGQMESDLLDCAHRLTANPNADCVKFITNMGDGDPAFLTELNGKLAKVCSNCIAKVDGIIGRSNGEDALWGKAEWIPDAQNPQNAQKARGALIIGVIRDGDWNIAMKWAGQNKIPNNPDTTVYDPNALNWINADSFTKAAEMYVSNTCLPVGFPIKGALGGKLKEPVCATGVVTWTPGDVTLAKKRGGLVPIMTTREDAFQMPCVLIGLKIWTDAHHDDVVKILAASFEAADQIRNNPAALQRGGEISTAIYKEENADYWVKYFKGTREQDATGVTVALGGSAVSDLADNIQMFGLDGGRNLFESTYNTFGRIDVQQYPTIIPSFLPVGQILDKSFVIGVRQLNTLSETSTENQDYTKSNAPVGQIAGKRDYSIQFRTGSAEILPVSFAELNQLVDDIVITKYTVESHGFTDATGTPEGNITLSQTRADSVKAYLTGHGVRNAIKSFAHGQEMPVADNSTAAGRAQNRRVQIILRTVGQ